MECTALTDRLDQYIAGRLPESEAAAVEAHASTCEVCEHLLESATAGEWRYAPAPPSDLRAHVLAAVDRSAAALGTPNERTAGYRGQVRRRVAALSTLAAAALLAFFLWPRRSEAPDGTAHYAPAASVAPGIGLVAIAEYIADQTAQPEFAALDAAAAELTDALSLAPNDTELLSYLAAVRARRDELQRRIDEAIL
jgi:anti-sigma factor RsiW